MVHHFSDRKSFLGDASMSDSAQTPWRCQRHNADIVGSVFTQAFHLAVTRLGNVDALAQQLGVEVSTVHNWLYGTRMPPFKYFLRVIDIITSDVPEDPYVRAAPDSDEPPPVGRSKPL